MSSIRNRTIGTWQSTASCTSRSTCSELFECREKISSITLLCWIARVISPGKERPGRTSRGATQHWMPESSNAPQMVSATFLSWAEWEMKTSRGITGPVRFYLLPGEPATELMHEPKRKSLAKDFTPN